MSFTSGNVKSINEFVDTMATYAVANESWVVLDGSVNQSDSAAFPANSRYYRIQFEQPADLSDGEIATFDMRATVGGADLGISTAELTSHNGSNGITNIVDNIFDGSSVTRWDFPTNVGIIDLDFGADQTIRQLVVGAISGTGGGAFAPTVIRFYRSEDGIYWDLIHTFSGLSWASGETKALTLPADLALHSSSTATGGVRRPCKYYLQGPGYDADRRVYVGFEIFQDFTDGNQGFRMTGATAYNASLLIDNQLQATPREDTPHFVIDNSGEDIDYWLYVNSTRIIGVLRSGAGDYAMFYAGFLASFANPDQHPNPLYLAGTSPNIGNTVTPDFLLWNEADTRNSAFWDPGIEGGLHLDYKGDWMFINNNRTLAALGRYPIVWVPPEEGFISPWHNGNASSGGPNGGFPYIGLEGDVNGDHFLKRQIITLQDELPVFDAIIQTLDYGHIGALQGVVAVPAASALTPEQTITIGAVTYRVFPKRTLRDNAQWVGIAEQ